MGGPGGMGSVERMTGLDGAFLALESPTTHLHIVGVLVLDPSEEVIRVDLPPHPGTRRRSDRAGTALPHAHGRGPARPRSPGARRRRVPRPRLSRASGRTAETRWAARARGAGCRLRLASARPPPAPVGDARGRRTVRRTASPSSPRCTTPSSTAWPARSCWPPSSISSRACAGTPVTRLDWRRHGAADGGRDPAERCMVTRRRGDLVGGRGRPVVGAVRIGARSRGCGLPVDRADGAEGPFDGRPMARRRRSRLPACRCRAPRTSINRAISPHRRVSFADLAMDDVRRVRDVLGGTVNDVVLAATAGSLRRFFAGRGEVVDGPLVAMAPVSVRAEQTDVFARQPALGSARQPCPRRRRIPSTGSGRCERR